MAKRILITINEDIEKWLNEESQRTGATISEVVRRAIIAQSKKDIKEVKHGGYRKRNTTTEN